MATVNSEQSVEISPWLSCRSPVLLSEPADRAAGHIDEDSMIA